MKRSYIRRKSPRRISKQTPEEREYLEAVAGLRCMARYLGPCEGPVQAHHAGKKPGMGMRADDYSGIPLCFGHHIIDWHGATGVFKGWGREKRREWAALCIGLTRAVLGHPVKEIA